MVKVMWCRRHAEAAAPTGLPSTGRSLQGWSVAIARILNLRGPGYSLLLHELAPAPTLTCAAALGLPVEPRSSPVSPLCLDLTFEECPLTAIDGASDPVVRLAMFHRK